MYQRRIQTNEKKVGSTQKLYIVSAVEWVKLHLSMDRATVGEKNAAPHLNTGVL